tara:strand:- start:61 stop:396 length:336 start_codon:yes stop_codon:yes gene_type:complete
MGMGYYCDGCHEVIAPAEEMAFSHEVEVQPHVHYTAELYVSPLTVNKTLVGWGSIPTYYRNVLLKLEPLDISGLWAPEEEEIKHYCMNCAMTEELINKNELKKLMGIKNGK